MPFAINTPRQDKIFIDQEQYSYPIPLPFVKVTVIPGCSLVEFNANKTLGDGPLYYSWDFRGVGNFTEFSIDAETTYDYGSIHREKIFCVIRVKDSRNVVAQQSYLVDFEILTHEMIIGQSYEKPIVHYNKINNCPVIVYSTDSEIYYCKYQEDWIKSLFFNEETHNLCSFQYEDKSMIICEENDTGRIIIGQEQNEEKWDEEILPMNNGGLTGVDCENEVGISFLTENYKNKQDLMFMYKQDEKWISVQICKNISAGMTSICSTKDVSSTDRVPIICSVTEDKNLHIYYGTYGTTTYGTWTGDLVAKNCLDKVCVTKSLDDPLTKVNNEVVILYIQEENDKYYLRTATSVDKKHWTYNTIDVYTEEIELSNNCALVYNDKYTICVTNGRSLIVYYKFNSRENSDVNHEDFHKYTLLTIENEITDPVLLEIDNHLTVFYTEGKKEHYEIKGVTIL